MKLVRSIVLLGVFAFSACGGGGGGSDSAPENFAGRWNLNLLLSNNSCNLNLADFGLTTTANPTLDVQQNGGAVAATNPASGFQFAGAAGPNGFALSGPQQTAGRCTSQATFAFENVDGDFSSPVTYTFQIQCPADSCAVQYVGSGSR